MAKQVGGGYYKPYPKKTRQGKSNRTKYGRKGSKGHRKKPRGQGNTSR